MEKTQDTPCSSIQEGALLQRIKNNIPPEDYAELSALLTSKNQSIKNLKQALFGSKNEKSKKVLPDDPRKPDKPNHPPKGHGRRHSEDHTNATEQCIAHETLRSGQRCPHCGKGRVYVTQKPAVIVRIHGHEPFSTTITRLQRLRCNTCGKSFTASAPADISTSKYDPAAVAMMALLKYGKGFPFHRLDKFMQTLGMHLPATTQWDILNLAAGDFESIFAALCRQAAQASLFHNDDTPVKIMDLKRKIHRKNTSDSATPQRRALQTSSIIAQTGLQRLALYFSGHDHAGENLAKILALRAPECSTGAAAPLQMCDGKPENVPKEFTTIVSNCLAHARRKYVEIYDNFPEECRFIIEIFKGIYKNEAHARTENLTPETRMCYHKDNSLPLLNQLKTWFHTQFEQKRIEPNSNLGQAIRYMTKRWTELTRFTQIPGVPLDNNICERALKMAIRSRKNSLFYKSVRGAKVGDIFMSLIHTCELNKINPFHYFIAVLNNPDLVRAQPDNWTPLNFHSQLS